MALHGVVNSMSNYGLVFDSTVYLKEEIIKENNAKVASLNVVDGLESYREVEVKNKWIFERQDSGAGLKTSQPSPGEFFEIFEDFIKEGKEKIFVVTLSKNISGTFQSATLAKNMLVDPEKVYVFDTSLCAFGNEMIALELIEMVKSKETAENIITRINGIIESSTQMFSVENLFSLAKGGRLTATQAMLGTVLRIKPIIKIIDGRLVLDKKERSHKKVFKYFMENIQSSLVGKSKITFYVTESNSLETGEQLMMFLKNAFPESKITFSHYLGPVFSIHIGKKGYGLSWFTE